MGELEDRSNRAAQGLAARLGEEAISQIHLQSRSLHKRF